MLSSISGKYFAGHLVQPPPLPDSLARYSLPLGSYPGTGDTVNDLSGNNRNLLALSISYDANQPRSMQFPSGQSAFTSDFSEGISMSHYQTITFWYYQTADIPAGQSPLCSISSSFNYDGAYILSLPGTRLQLITNGGTLDNRQTLPSGTVTPGTWQMITFKYILSPTLPSVLYINGSQIYSYVHGSDFVQALTFRIDLDMAYGFGKWSDFALYDEELSPAQITARFNATRAYYGV